MGATRHCAALQGAGAQPIILRNDMDPLSVIVELGLCGLVFSGGGDIAAGSYGGDESLVRDDIDFRRDTFEFALMERALAEGLPVLAACRGMHVLNVVLDGTLIEDLRRCMGANYQVMHDQVRDCGLPYNAYVHDVIVAPNALLYEIAAAKRFPVNSMHHQAIAELGKGLHAVAHSEDGVIEAVELDGYSNFFVGVQWHPEWIPEDAVSRRLYTRLLRGAQRSPSQGFQDVRSSHRR